MAPSREKVIADFIKPLRVKPGSKVQLPSKDFDPGYTGHLLTKKQGKSLLMQGVELLAEYQMKLAAQGTCGVVLALQSLDAGGKDGTIRHVMSGVNPQGVSVTSFKVPSSEELSHDYLWRYNKALPERGGIGIFNRSHYEEVLVVRVHPENLVRQQLPAVDRGKDVWARRYEEINNWERYLAENGIKMVKIFLNLSKEEQRYRFLSRIDLPEKNWKFSPNDIKERAFWDDYQLAFSEMLSNTSTPWAPWYVVPADNKWFGRIATAAILAHTLIDIDPQFPTVDPAIKKELANVHAELAKEAPAGADADPVLADLKRAAGKKAAKIAAGT